MRKENMKQIGAAVLVWLLALGMIGCQAAANAPTDATDEALLAVTTEATEPEVTRFVSTSRYQATLPPEPTVPETEPTEETEATELPDAGGANAGGSTNSSGGGSASSGSGENDTSSGAEVEVIGTWTTPSSSSSAATTPADPVPTEHTHTWQEIWHEEVGHYSEWWITCLCGARFSTLAEWSSHSASYSGEEALQHGGWGETSDYIIDVPGYSTWYCPGCGATSDTQP